MGLLPCAMYAFPIVSIWKHLGCRFNLGQGFRWLVTNDYCPNFVPILNKKRSHRVVINVNYYRIFSLLALRPPQWNEGGLLAGNFSHELASTPTTCIRFYNVAPTELGYQFGILFTPYRFVLHCVHGFVWTLMQDATLRSSGTGAIIIKLLRSLYPKPWRPRVAVALAEAQA